MNNLPSRITVSKTLLFVDDTKIYNTVHKSEDISAFQNDLDSASLWSKRNDMCFNPQKSVHLINSKVTTNYKIADTQVVTNSSHKDLGITISSDLSWDQHYKNIIPKAYRMLGLLRRSFSRHQTVTAKKTLYISLVRSQVTYCSMIWRPNLIRDITLIEQIQRRATKFILNDYSSNYFNRFKQLNLLPLKALMYILEFNEIVFILKLLKHPSPSFNITDFISFADGNIRSSTRGKMIHVRNNNNTSRHFFFNRIPRLWNALPSMDLSLSIATNKRKVHNFYGHIFYLAFNMITRVHFIFYAHVVDAPTHPAPLYCNSSISNVIL